MKRGNNVIKASNIYYWDLNRPDRLYQIAEEYYQKAQEYQQEYSFQKAKVCFQKAEECYQRVRDACQAKRQADEAKKRADEAKKQAEEVYAPSKISRRIYKSQQAAEYHGSPIPSPIYPQPLTRQQTPMLKPSIATASAQKLRQNQGNNATPIKAVKHNIKSADELNVQLPSVIQDTPENPEKKIHRPISWRGKKHS